MEKSGEKIGEKRVVKKKVARPGRTGFRGFLNERAARYGRSEKSN